MASFVITGLVPTSWANNTNLVGTAVGHKQAEMTIDSGPMDATAFAATLRARSFITGLRSVTAKLTGRWNPAYNCSGIGLTFANGYVANMRKFNVNLAWDVHDLTVGTGSAITARSFSPGLLTGSGTFECFVDDTTDLAVPGGGQTGSATFKMIENGTTDHTLAGTIILENLGINMEVGGKAIATYGYKFSGDITGTGSGGTYPDSPFTVAGGNQGIPTKGALVLTSTGSQTYTVSAFPSGISVEAEVGQELKVTVMAQGDGDVTLSGGFTGT